MAHKVNKHHYIATPDPGYVGHRGYSTDGEESQHTPSEYTLAHSRASPERVHHSHRNTTRPVLQHSDNEGSDIYVTSAAYRAPSEISRGPSHYDRAPSEFSTRTKNSRKGGLMVETMSAPNPFCPNTKGICCLMLLLNLGIILVTLGFVIVIQFYEPVFVWILGIVFLVFGFMTLIGSLVYCVHVCRDAKGPNDVRPEDLYWTHHWQKTLGPPEIHYKPEDKYPDERYSDRYSERDRRSDRY